MDLRLTYQGLLLASGPAAHKHEIRRVFHRQLKRYWEVHSGLREARHPLQNFGGGYASQDFKLSPPRAESLANEFERNGYNYVPLVTADSMLICAIEILFLRPGKPGVAIQSGDIDNRLKTLFDALRMPHHKGELGGYNEPLADERPFFVLLQDDGLITHVSVETDTLLEPVGETWNANDARLVITVRLKPHIPMAQNAMFS